MWYSGFTSAPGLVISVSLVKVPSALPLSQTRKGHLGSTLLFPPVHIHEYKTFDPTDKYLSNLSM